MVSCRRRSAQGPRAYSRAELERVAKAAWGCVRGVTGVSHITPRAYCIGRLSSHCAAFVIPPQDREVQLRGWPYSATLVQNESAEAVCTGDWASLAYVQHSGCGERRVVIGPDGKAVRAVRRGPKTSENSGAVLQNRRKYVSRRAKRC